MAVDLWNRENEEQKDSDIWKWGDQKTIAFVMFTLNPKENYWCAARRAFFDTYEDYEIDKNDKVINGKWVHNLYYYVASGNGTNAVDASGMEITLADQFFAAVKSGDVVCAPNTKVYIIMHSQMSGSYEEEIFEGTWGTLDDFVVSAERFPVGNKLVKHLAAQMKSLRTLMQGELTEEDYVHMKREEKTWLASMRSR